MAGDERTGKAFPEKFSGLGRLRRFTVSGRHSNESAYKDGFYNYYPSVMMMMGLRKCVACGGKG